MDWLFLLKMPIIYQISRVIFNNNPIIFGRKKNLIIKDYQNLFGGEK